MKKKREIQQWRSCLNVYIVLQNETNRRVRFNNDVVVYISILYSKMKQKQACEIRSSHGSRYGHTRRHIPEHSTELWRQARFPAWTYFYILQRTIIWSRVTLRQFGYIFNLLYAILPAGLKHTGPDRNSVRRFLRITSCGSVVKRQSVESPNCKVNPCIRNGYCQMIWLEFLRLRLDWRNQNSGRAHWAGGFRPMRFTSSHWQ
jgi:hypothetical protein